MILFPNFFISDIFWSDPDDLIGSGSGKKVRIRTDPKHSYWFNMLVAGLVEAQEAGAVANQPLWVDQDLGPGQR